MKGSLVGIDYGTKRVGVAVASRETGIALPKTVLQNDDTFWEKIKELIREYEPEIIVVGESKNFEGDDNKLMDRIRGFVETLKEEGVTVTLEPEYYTSQQAERLQGKSGMLDASAAAVLLQAYLDRENSATES